MKTPYYVQYEVFGQPCPITAGPYDTHEEACEQAHDIRGFMGVSNVEIYSPWQLEKSES